MQTILTLTMNPSVDKTADIDQVVPERKLHCQTICHEPGGAESTLPESFESWATSRWPFI